VPRFLKTSAKCRDSGDLKCLDEHWEDSPPAQGREPLGRWSTGDDRQGKQAVTGICQSPLLDVANIMGVQCVPWQSRDTV